MVAIHTACLRPNTRGSFSRSLPSQEKAGLISRLNRHRSRVQKQPASARLIMRQEPPLFSDLNSHPASLTPIVILVTRKTGISRHFSPLKNRSFTSLSILLYTRALPYCMIQTKVTSCPYCDSRNLMKKGTRNNHTRKLQVYRCRNCWKYFTPLGAVKTKYTPELLSRALLWYYQGYPQEKVALLLKARQRVTIPCRTLGKWIAKYKGICTFHPFRKTALSRFSVLI